MRRILEVGLGTTLLLASATTLAGGPGAVRKQVEASMLVTGKIQVDTAGKVSGFSLDQKDKLPAGVVGILDKEVPTWTFEPVQFDGKPANVTTEMSVRLVAKKLDADSYSVTIRSAGFGDAADKFPSAKAAANRNYTGKVCKTGLTPPAYPENAARAGVGSNVYLLLKVAPDGKVLDAIAEQVNVKAIASEPGMARWRRVFSDVALSRARKWCVEPGTAGPQDGFGIVRVPVQFRLEGMAPVYGRWEAYVPGPRQSSPWKQGEEVPSFSPDTLAPGRAYVAGAGLKLLTDLSGS